MSIGGKYIVVKNEQIKTINQLLENEKFTSFSLEQAWDAIRVLGLFFDINLLGTEPFELNVGEMSFLINGTDILLIKNKLDTLTQDEVKLILDSNVFKNSDFYFDNYYLNHSNELLEIFLNLKNFFFSLTDNDNLIFIIN